MFGFLSIFLFFLGIGAFIGLVYGLVRYLIPTMIWGIGHLVKCFIEGWREEAARQKKK